MDMDTWELLSQGVDFAGDWECNEWVIMKVQDFAAFVRGLFSTQSFHLHPLWQGIQDPSLGNWSGCFIVQLDQMAARCGLETCLFEWNQHLEGMWEWVARGLKISMENM